MPVIGPLHHPALMNSLLMINLSLLFVSLLAQRYNEKFIHFILYLNQTTKTKETEVGTTELSSIQDCSSEYTIQERTGNDRKM